MENTSAGMGRINDERPRGEPDSYPDEDDEWATDIDDDDDGLDRFDLGAYAGAWR